MKFLKRYALVVLAFFHLAVTRGVRGSFGVFYVALLQAFGWSRGATAGAVSLGIMVEGFSFPFVGVLTDRLGAHRTLILGGFFLTFGLAFSSTLSSLWELYLWWGVVIALGLAMTGMVPHVTILSRTFTEPRATVLGFAYTGMSFGAILLVPLAQIMIGSWGRPGAYLGLSGMTALLVLVPAWLFLPPLPQEFPKVKKERGGGTSDWTAGRALRNPVFWFLFGCRFISSVGTNIVNTHQIAHAVDIGYTKIFAAAIFGLMGFSGIFGKLFFGFLADHMRREVVFTIVQGLASLGVVALIFTQDTSLPVLLYSYALLYGLGAGTRALILSALSADLFSGKNFGAIYGYFTLSVALGGGLGSWLGGALYDIRGNYFVAFLVAFICFALSIPAVLLSRRLPRPSD